MTTTLLVIVWLRKRVRNLLAAVDGAYEDEKGASSDDEAERAC